MRQFRRALVTGGAGFIGSHICDALVKDGVEVCCMDNLETGDLGNIIHLRGNPLFQFSPGHVASSRNVRDAMEGCDVVFHQAALKMGLCKTVATAMKYNAQGTYIVAEEAARVGASLIHASTGSVYGNSPGVQVRPISIYGMSKAAGEDAVRMIWDKNNSGRGADLRPEGTFTILRYHHVYGPRQSADPLTGGVVPIFIKQILTGKPVTIHGDGLQTRRFIHVRDVVEANLYAASTLYGLRVEDILGPTCVTIMQLAWMIARITGMGELRLRFCEARDGDIRDFSEHPMPDCSITVGLEEGLRDTIDYWKNRLPRKES